MERGRSGLNWPNCVTMTQLSIIHCDNTRYCLSKLFLRLIQPKISISKRLGLKMFITPRSNSLPKLAAKLVLLAVLS